MGTMKVSILLAFTLLSSFAFAAEKEKTVQKSGVQGDIVVNDSLQKLLDVPGVKPIYEECKKNNQAYSENIPTCIWDNVKNKPELKKMVMQTYADTNKSAPTEGRSPASSKTNMVTSAQVASIDYSSDPSVQALSEFYGKKLDEILDPDKALSAAEKDKNVIVTVDHRKFIDLYKSELGKTIINAFTSYCLDTDPKSCDKGLCLLREKMDEVKEDRDTNLKSIKSTTFDLASGTASSRKWTSCIFNVAQVCEGNAGDSGQTINSRSKQRACLITDYVKTARKNIQIADKQKEFYTSLEKEGTTQIASNMKIVTDGEKASSDSILKITKKEVEDSLKKPDEANLAEIDQCMDVDTKTIKNVEVCKKFLSTNKTANEVAFAELGMRQLAQEEMLTEELKDDEKVREYLKEEGFKDEEIQKLTASAESIEEIRSKILARFKNEKEAIIEEMRKKIETKTSSSDGKIDNQDISKLEKIRNDLASRTSDLSNLMQFNNIVSSYLETNDKKSGTNERNTASLFAEAKTMDGAEGKALQEQIKKADLKENKGNSTIDLNVNEINNSFIKYNSKLQEQQQKKN
ncbi:hypothetical protein C8D79_2891 [Bacteriovorax stolpii]|nr:hypothetical protein C8D79_2891 [Bacteriovorax stolpii]